MEWLHRMDSRLVELVREKFSTKLSAGSNILIAMIETLSKNINCYVTILNASRAIGADTLIKTLRNNIWLRTFKLMRVIYVNPL